MREGARGGKEGCVGVGEGEEEARLDRGGGMGTDFEAAEGVIERAVGGRVELRLSAEEEGENSAASLREAGKIPYMSS